jgi:hypothetical protein
MPCYSPLTAWRSRRLNENGKRPLVWHRNDGFEDMEVQVPCGQCVGCRLEKSRQWAIRCMHEADLYQDNCFITLTYDDDHLPYDGSLVKPHFQKFMKRLRKRYGTIKIRYYACGEYGDSNYRPHYHALLFNFDFEDKILWKTEGDFRLYVSEELNSIWKKGYCIIGPVTFETAAYVARYVMKKQTEGSTNDAQERFDKAYRRIDPYTGELYYVEPDFSLMSRRPGIGRDWIDKYSDTVFRDDSIIVNGYEVKPPKYYDSLFDGIELTKAQRRKDSKRFADNNTPDRLEVREKVAKSKLSKLTRKLEI